LKRLGGRFAQYHDRLYKSHAVSGSDRVPLTAYGDTAPEPGFEQISPGVWRKQVPRDAVTKLYDIHYECTYRGLNCWVNREDDDGRLEVMYVAGDAFAARDAGLDEIDRGVFRSWVDRSEVPDLHEVRNDILTRGC
jgi:hypothetical protein